MRRSASLLLLLLVPVMWHPRHSHAQNLPSSEQVVRPGFGTLKQEDLQIALATTAIFTFIWTWNDFFSQLIFLTRPEMYTVPIALRTFVDSTGESSWGSLFAMSIVSLIPVFIAFLFGQKYLVKGIATTGIK